MADPTLPSDPKQLALMFKRDIESATDQGVPVFQVQPDGRVKMSPQRGGGYAPPWVWAGTLPIAKGPDGQLTDIGRKLVTPGSDPSSAWNSMFEAGGPFRKQSQWDDKTGTYEGRIDWATLLGTVAAGGIIGAGIAGAGGGVASLPSAAPSAAPAASAVVPGVSSGAGLVGAGTSATTAAEAAAAAAATPGLASTTIGSGFIPAVTGGTGSAVTAAAGGVPSYLSTLKDVGQTATDLAKGRAEGRALESGLVNNDNRTATDLYRAQLAANAEQNRYGLDAAGQENDFASKNYGLGLDTVNTGINVGRLDLDQKNYALDAPGKRASNSVRGDILANAQDVSIDGPSTIPKFNISGGLRPSMFSANTRALGGEMSAQALSQQRAGDVFPQLPAMPGPLPTYKAPAPYVNPPKAPTMQQGPQANGFDTGLNIAGYAGLGADLLSKYGKYFF